MADPLCQRRHALTSIYLVRRRVPLQGGNIDRATKFTCTACGWEIILDD